MCPAKSRQSASKGKVGDLVSIRITSNTYGFARIINISDGWNLLEVLSRTSKSPDIDDAVRGAPGLYPPVSFYPPDLRAGRIVVKEHMSDYVPGYIDRLRYVAGTPGHHELLKVNQFQPVGTVSDEQASRLPRREFYDFEGMVDRIKARLKANTQVAHWLAGSGA